MIHLDILNISVVSDFGIVPLSLSFDDDVLPFCFLRELLHNFVCEKIRIDDFWLEGMGGLEKFFLPYIFTFVYVSVDFALILYVASDEVGIRVDF